MNPTDSYEQRVRDKGYVLPASSRDYEHFHDSGFCEEPQAVAEQKSIVQAFYERISKVIIDEEQ